MFESPDKLLLGLLTGFCFGFLLQKGRVAKYRVILGQLLLKDWTVLKIMLTAIVVGAAGVYALVAVGVTYLDVWPFQVAAVLLGAVLFGVGLALFGYCPGTSIAASAEGSRDAMVGVVGMLCGAAVFVVAYPRLHPVIMALGDYGAMTVPTWLGMSPWIVIASLGVIGAVIFAIIERHERRAAMAEVSPAETARDARPDHFDRPGTGQREFTVKQIPEENPPRETARDRKTRS